MEDYTKLYLERDRLRSPNAVSGFGLCGAVRLVRAESGAPGPRGNKKKTKETLGHCRSNPGGYLVSTRLKKLTLVAQNVKWSWSWVCFGLIRANVGLFWLGRCEERVGIVEVPRRGSGL